MNFYALRYVFGLYFFFIKILNDADDTSIEQWTEIVWYIVYIIYHTDERGVEEHWFMAHSASYYEHIWSSSFLGQNIS